PTAIFLSLHYSPTPSPYSLPLHDALPISGLDHEIALRHVHAAGPGRGGQIDLAAAPDRVEDNAVEPQRRPSGAGPAVHPARPARSEEHTSELQSRVDLVCRLLPEIETTHD